jgi:RNA polymerase sigma-70 factor, ECF subfamily
MHRKLYTILEYILLKYHRLSIIYKFFVGFGTRIRSAMMEPKLIDDRNLIKRAIAGDNSAFAELINRHYHVLYGLAISMLREPSRAEDALQDGIIQIYQNLKALHQPEKFRSWAYTIIKRQCLLALKASKSEPISISDLNESDDKTLDKLTVPADADIRLDRQHQIDLIQQAMLKLPLKYREVAILFFLEEKTIQEIIEILGITYAAAEKRLLRVRAKLQKKLKRLEQ